MFKKEEKLNKIVEYGLYLLIFLLPLQTRWIIKAGMINGGYFEYGTISLYGTDIVLIFLLILFVCINLKKSKQVESQKLKVKSYWWLIAGLDLFVFISIFFAPDKILAIYRYGLFLLGVGLFWLVINASYDKIKLYYFFLIGVFLQACLGIWQFLNQSSFANKWFGLAVHDPSELGVSVVEVPATALKYSERWLRAYGGFDHPNILGGVLAIGTLLAIYLIIKRTSDKKFIHYTLYIILYTLITALFFTFSRGAWIAAIVGTLIVLGGLVIKRDLRAQKEMLIAILISGFLIGLLFFQYSDLVTTRLSDDSRLEIKSRVERVASYHEAWQIIKKHPLFGASLGNYTLAVHNELALKESNWYYQPAHNTILLIWSEIGLIGVMFFVGLFVYLIISNFQPACRTGRFQITDNILNISILTAIILTMCVDHWWWSLHFGVLFFWLILGLMIKSSDCNKI